MTASPGRFWAENQRDEYMREVPRDMALAAIRTLAAHDALDLAPMLLGPMNPHTTGKRI